MTRVADRDGEGVGGVVGLRRSRQAEQGADHSLNLLLGRRAASADRHLHRLWGVVEARHAALARGQQDHAPGLTNGDSRAHVLAEVDVLEGDRHRLVPGQKLGERLMDAYEAALGGLASRRLDDAPVDRAHLAARDADHTEPGARHARVDAHDDHHW